MKKALLFTTFAMAGLWAMPRAEANPVMMCMPEEVTSTSAQSVELAFEIDAAFVTGTLELYRDSAPGEVDPESPTAVLVSTFTAQDGTASQGDTGSGVVNTIKFSVQEDCVPVGSWSWDVFSVDGGGMWCPLDAQITVPDPACSGAGGSGTGGAATGGSGGAGAGDTGGAGATGGADPVPVPMYEDDDGGCAVRAVASPVGQAGWLGLALGLGLWWRRRRR